MSLSSAVVAVPVRTVVAPGRVSEQLVGMVAWPVMGNHPVLQVTLNA